MDEGSTSTDIPGPPPVAEPDRYSKAFEAFVKGENDVAGLLAYALFKEHIRQQVMGGTRQDAAARNPSPALVDAFRSAAEIRISALVDDAITQATPTIKLSAAIEAAESVKGEITSFDSKVDAKLASTEASLTRHIDRRTNNWIIVGLNIAGWLVSLLIVFLVSYAFAHKDPGEVVGDAGKSIGIHAGHTTANGNTQ